MTTPDTNPMQHLRHAADVTRMLLAYSVRSATKFVSPNTVVRAHRITLAGRIDKRDKGIDIRLKIGRPNYHERLFIKACLSAGEPFPVKRVRLAHFRPRKPVKAKRIGKGKKRT